MQLSKKRANNGFLTWGRSSTALIILLFFVFGSRAFATSFSSDVILTLPVHESNTSVFATPLAYANEQLYVLSIEPGTEAENGRNLRTIIRQGKEAGFGRWRWKRKTIEPNTIDDPYHNQASVGIDDKGYVHVVYNMHNLPWQYKVSAKPHSVTRFKFKGEKLIAKTLDELLTHNKNKFRQFGMAKIPGTQVTYPAFFNDRNGVLYVTYRYATKPKRQWNDRDFAGGIARYDSQRKAWEPIGAPLAITQRDADFPKGSEAINYPFALQPRWSVYLIRLHFDEQNQMHLSWTWRKGGAGRVTSHPSYAFSADQGQTFQRADGSDYRLPITVPAVDVIGDASSGERFLSHTAITRWNEKPCVALNPDGPGRFMRCYDGQQWQKELTPGSAAEILTDKHGDLWAIASGPRVYHRQKSGVGGWKQHFQAIGKKACLIRPLYVREAHRLFLYEHLCNEDTIRVREVNLSPA